MKEYPLFVPPLELCQKNARDWTLQEARQYRDWLLASIDERVSFLLKFLNVPETKNQDVEEIMSAAGKKAAQYLQQKEFSECDTEKKKLTDRGYALAADMGLLLAKLLLKESRHKIRWSVLRRPKSEISYNLPVLEGFKLNPLEPIGGSIAEAYGILRERKDGNIWRDSYTYWLDQIPPD
ncbi:hypothetical protein CA11_15300 [Gimesia maris]|uniref:hypothetical protein n=1 Tax=Gimesia maris TaxID=122 RepID=UPI00118D0BD2|nr:hypothetical protein [Gimesia maris]QDU13744.1 hypothetical protein CA11_15300 [Gimesia maris]